MRGIPDASDIERLRSELQILRRTAEKHRLLIEATDTGFVILDESGRVLDANTEYAKLTGHERVDQITGRLVTEWTAPGDRARNAAEVRNCLELGTVRNLEIDYLSPDGRVTPVEINATVSHTPTGVTILTVCRDISSRRRAEEALRDSEQRYRSTIESLAEAIHVVDPDLRIEILNETGRRWMRDVGIAGEIVGHRIFEVFPFLPQSVRDEYRRVFAGEGPLITQEWNTIGGREIATETRKIPIVEAGRVVRVLTAMRDVTESLRAQERLRQTEKLEALGQLVGGIAHDFNNQLTAILAYAELLARGAEGAKVRDYAKAIVRSAERSSDLTRRLCTFARKGRVRLAPLDLHGVLEEVAALLGRTIDPSITVRMRLLAPRATTHGDAAQLQSAFLNLALNARDAMPEGGVLTFATDVAPADGAAGPELPSWASTVERLRIQVADTGVGMSDDVRRHLFEPFFTTKDPGHGTGMGLAAVYGTVTAHHGTIQVETAPARGSTFTVLLPLTQQIQAHDGAASVEAPAEGRGHVLVADDNPDVLQVTAEALGALGYRVTAQPDGGAAVAAYRQAWNEIDLVLLDVTMPALGGVAALVEMRRINPELRAVLYSGHPPGHEEQRLIDEGITAFLEKPFTMTELARIVSSMTPALNLSAAAPGVRSR